MVDDRERGLGVLELPAFDVTARERAVGGTQVGFLAARLGVYAGPRGHRRLGDPSLLV